MMTKSSLVLILLFFGALSSLPVEAQQTFPTALRIAADANNPYNSPIRRANPNSRQGTAPTTTPLPASQRPMNNPRPPTLENRGIGNGDNLRRPPTRSPATQNRQSRPVPTHP